MISVFHSDVEVYVCLTEQFEMFWRGVKGISSERKTYQGLRKFRCECPRCQAIDDTRGMQCDRCGPSGHVGTWSPGCFFWFYSMTPWAISKGWFSRNGYCSWWMLVISADAPEKNWSMTSSLSLFPSFFVGASPMFFEIKSKNPLLLRFPHFCWWKSLVFVRYIPVLRGFWVLVTPSRPWLPSRFPFQDVDTTGLWKMKRGRPAASARRKQKRQTWRRRAERRRNLEYHLLLSIYRDTPWLCQNSYWKWP